MIDAVRVAAATAGSPIYEKFVTAVRFGRWIGYVVATKKQVDVYNERLYYVCR
jgi:hypothetical protein